MSEKIKVIFNGNSIEMPKEIISQGVEKGEITITDESLLLFKKEEYETRTKNIEKENYNKGKRDGVEIEWKETKRKLGLEIEGKNGDEIIDAYRNKILADAKVEPNKKIQDLEADNAKLKSNFLKAEQEKTEAINSFAVKEKEIKTNSLLFNDIPDAAATTFTKSDIAALFKANGYSIDIVDGKEVTLFNGEIMKNEKTLEPIPHKLAVEKFVTDKGFIKAADGRGEGDKGNNKVVAGTLEAFSKEMEDRNIKFNSTEYIKEMQTRIKDKTLKI